MDARAVPKTHSTMAQSREMQTESGDKKRIPEAEILLFTMRTRWYLAGILTLHILASSTYHPDYSPLPRDKTVDAQPQAPNTHAAYLLQCRRLLKVDSEKQPAILLERRTSQKKEWW